MVRQFYDVMLARVQNDGEFSDPSPVTDGVKQGCVLPPTLFSMLFSVMLTDDFQDGGNGIPTQWAHNVKMTSYQRRCDVMTSYQRRCDVMTSHRR